MKYILVTDLKDNYRSYESLEYVIVLIPNSKISFV